MTGDAILTGLHVLFATIWVGPQLLAAAAVVPALRAIDDDRTRLATLRRFTRRFNLVAWPAMAGLVITGLIMEAERRAAVEAIAAPFGGDIFDVRWGYIFSAKMAIVLVAILAVALHSFVTGPRILALLEAAAERSEAGAQARAQRLRRWSVLLAVIGLLASLLTVIAAGFLQEDALALRQI
ncbi:MAG: CopD family protein [Chloroflexi bacterium]|nr:CopD family protein [Chloroflexota bacterium]